MERESRLSGIIDGQNLLESPAIMVTPGSDLPDYATAISDPRFAKKPMYPTPPPPYAAVVDLTPESTADQQDGATSAQAEQLPVAATATAINEEPKP